MHSTEQNDWSLLREYVERRSEAAFETLVRRHLDMVYSAAWRQTGDADLAEEAAQAAFVLLAQKGPHLRSGVVVAGWLYRTACLTARRAFRDQTRRRIKDQEAAQMRLTDSNDETWRRLAPHLDAALADLNDADRTAIVLRFLEQRSFGDLAQALSISEDAAKKRVTRGLEKLRAVFARRGVTLGVGAIAAALSARGVEAAPASLLQASVQAGLSGGVSAAPEVGTVVAGVVRDALISRLKWGSAVAGAVVLVALVGTLHGTRPGSEATERMQSPHPREAGMGLASQARQQRPPPPVSGDADGRSIVLRLVADENDQPLAQVPVHAEFIIMPQAGGSTFLTDAGGVASIVLPADPVDGMRLWVWTPGRVPMGISWNNKASMASLAPDYSLRLPRGRLIAGTVVDETGQPVAGATIHFQGDGMLWDSREFVDYEGPMSLPQSARLSTPTTDANGRWFANFISPAAKSLVGYVQHPDFATTQFGHIQPPGPVEPSTNLVLVLEQGSPVAGWVRDDTGAPIPEAWVNLGDELGLPARSMKTDAAGRFEFARVGSQEPLSLTATAEGFQFSGELPIRGGGATNLDIQLRAIRAAGNSVIRGRVIGVDGKPIGRVQVGLAPGQPGLADIHWGVITDPEGRFTWTSAPDHPVKLIVADLAQDWERRQIELAPDGQEAVITLKPKAKVSIHGTVSDRFSGKLLPEFTVCWAPGSKSGYVVNTSALADGRDGRFAVSLLPEQVRNYAPPGSGTRLDFHALGYVNKVVRLGSGTNDIALDIELEPATDIMGTVLCPDGTPAAGARVLFRSEHIRFRVADGLFVCGPASYPFAIETRTGTDGAFRIAKIDEIQRLEVVHPQGWANVGLDAPSTAVIRLQPWGRVSGVVRSGQNVLPGAEVRATQAKSEPEQMSFEYTVKTDAEGRFEFPNLPGGHARISAAGAADGQATNQAGQDIYVQSGRLASLTLSVQAR